MNKFMAAAIESVKVGIRRREGGPFGACIVKVDYWIRKDGKVY